MNDKELTELAAKAFGVAAEGFSPLADDGDALRLATALELDITFNAFGDSEVMVSDSKDRFDGWFTEPYGTDKAAATRRAIIRAAAAIVKDPK